MEEDNLPTPDDISSLEAELEFKQLENSIAEFNKAYDEPVDSRFLWNYIGGRQMGYGNDELQIIEDTAFSKIMDYMDKNDLHYTEIDVYDFIPEDKRLSPYLIFKENMRNEYYTDDFVEYMTLVTRRTPSGIYDMKTEDILDAPPSHYMAEYALKGAHEQGPTKRFEVWAKIINGDVTDGFSKKLKFKDFFKKAYQRTQNRDLIIRHVNNLFPGGSYEAFLEENHNRNMEKMGFTPEGDWLPEIKEKMVIKYTDVDGKVTYTDFYGKEVSPDDPRISDDSKFDELVKQFETPPEELTEEQKIKKLYDNNILTEKEYEQALKKEGVFSDTPTNVVDDIKLTGTTGGNTNVKGNNIAYVDVEELFPYVQYDRRIDTKGMPDDYIDNIKKTIYEKGLMYDNANEGVNVFSVFFDDTGNVQINEGNHRLRALFEVAQETGQKIYVPINPFITKITGGNKIQNVSTTNAHNAIKQLIIDILDGRKDTDYHIKNKLGEPGSGVSGLIGWTQPGYSGGTSTSQSNIKKFFQSIGINAIAYDELPDNSIYKTGVNTFTDTPPNTTLKVSSETGLSTHSDRIRQVAQDYHKIMGYSDPEFKPAMVFNDEIGAAAADIFEQLPMFDDAAIPYYRKFIQETNMQYQVLLDAGIEFEVVSGDPYTPNRAGHQEMIADMENGRLKVLATETGFGDEATSKLNPMLAESKYTDVNGRVMLENDVFRAVHDTFGHGMRGNTFGPIGEYNAWLAHKEMYSSDARRIMTTETLGQNTFTNYGPHMRDANGNLLGKADAGYIKPADRPFASQKVALMPEEIITAASNVVEDATEIVDKNGVDKTTQLANTNPEMSKSLWNTSKKIVGKAFNTTTGVLDPGDVAITQGLARVLPRIGLAAIAAPALSAYIFYELSVLAVDAASALQKAAEKQGVAGIGEEKDVDWKQLGKDTFSEFGEISDTWSLSWKISEPIIDYAFNEAANITMENK